VASELMNSENLSEVAKRYAEALCSHNPESVAAFFAENGSLSVNDGPPAVGRAAIAEEARYPALWRGRQNPIPAR
jgi:hypothetical protein